MGDVRPAGLRWDAEVNVTVRMNGSWLIVANLVAVLMLGGCEQGSGAPMVLVYKDPNCGCCDAWVDHMRAADFAVIVREVDSLDRIKEELGVPADLWSCHTATVGDYLIEGHVPAADVRRLLAEQPQGRGIAVPGMPLGSPGMEQGGHRQPYTVTLFGDDGARSTFASH